MPTSRKAALPASLAMNCRTEGVTCGAANRSAGPGLDGWLIDRPASGKPSERRRLDERALVAPFDALPW